LHSAEDLLVPALDRTLAALEPPAADDGLVALARVLAAALDRMSNAERRAMLGQTAPMYFKTLLELDARAAKRRKPVKRPPSQLDRLREARSRSVARQHGGS
jgi:hypothetical protein